MSNPSSWKGDGVLWHTPAPGEGHRSSGIRAPAAEARSIPAHGGRGRDERSGTESRNEGGNCGDEKVQRRLAAPCVRSDGGRETGGGAYQRR
jgi:hypothetical protein